MASYIQRTQFVHIYIIKRCRSCTITKRFQTEEYNSMVYGIWYGVCILWYAMVVWIMVVCVQARRKHFNVGGRNLNHNNLYNY